MVSLDDYKKMIEDRPEKFDEDQVNYRESDVNSECSGCLHFFERRIDSFAVCEIMRPDKDEDVKMNWVCDFFTKDGESFPLRPRAR